MHAFNTRIQETETGGSLSLKSACSTHLISGQSGPHRKITFKKKKGTGEHGAQIQAEGLTGRTEERQMNGDGGTERQVKLQGLPST